MSTNQPDIAKMQRAVSRALHEHWVLYLVEGIVLPCWPRPPLSCRR